VAEMEILVLISNCPQLNNPCSGFNPTPIGLAVWRQAG
ncbi:MAG: urea carboxylase, partial [Rhodospirillaceae bacterium]|nr:urea carboxylase [Rhodospirillaceae bacterium]